MKGPQRTACLAKGCNNGKYKWTEVLVMGKQQWKLKHILYNLRWRTRHGTHGRNYGPTDNMQFLVWPVHRTFARQLSAYQTCFNQRPISGYVWGMLQGYIHVHRVAIFLHSNNKICYLLRIYLHFFHCKHFRLSNVYQTCVNITRKH